MARKRSESRPEKPLVPKEELGPLGNTVELHNEVPEDNGSSPERKPAPPPSEPDDAPREPPSYHTGVYEQKSFIVAQTTTGEIIKDGAPSPMGFIQTLATSNVAWVDYSADDFQKEAPEVAALLGFSQTLINSLLKGSISAYEDLDREMGILIPALFVKQFEVYTSIVIILIRKTFILSIHGAGVQRFDRMRRYGETIIRTIPVDAMAQDKVTMVLIRLIDENNGTNFDHLREIELSGDNLSKTLADPKTPRNILGPEIYNMKHSLITYLSALWATLDVLNNLRYGDAELLTDDPRMLERVGALGAEVSGQIGLAEHLSEVLASGLEVLQSIYNNQLQILNNKLALLVAWLTILGTAVLVPNTLATIMGNTAFAMGPEDVGWYLGLMAGSTILATLLAWLWIMKQGWLPKEVE